MAFSDSKHQMWLHENHIHEGFTVTAELIRLFFFLFFFFLGVEWGFMSQQVKIKATGI